MRAVFCPDQTGGAGYLAYITPDGKRWRQTYADLIDLEADGGVVTGSVELKGAAGQRFLDRYQDGAPYAGAVLARPKAGSRWAAEVARLDPDDRPPFLVYPSGVIVRADGVANQADVDRFIGVKDLGEIDDWVFYNGTLQPWASVGIELNVDEIEMDGVKVGLTPEALAQVAGAVNDEAHARSAE
jgi:hypothetical protein